MPKIVRSKKPSTGGPVHVPPAAPKPAIAAPRVQPKAPSPTGTARILLIVENGKVEWDRLPGDTKKQIEELFKNPEFLAQFGLSPQTTFSPDQVKHIYTAIGVAYQTVARSVMRFHPQAAELLTYNEQEKTMLAEPTANLANQYAGDFLKKHSALIVWASVFGAITQQKFAHAIQLEGEIRKRENAAAPVRPAPPARPAQTPAPAPMASAAAAGSSLEE